MNRIRHARPSPRVENGGLFWYEGDTFRLWLGLEIRDGTGLQVHLTPEDSLEVEFRDVRRDRVESIRFSGEALALGGAEIQMDETRTARFPKGAYTYDVILTHGERITLAKNNPITVEG